MIKSKSNNKRQYLTFGNQKCEHDCVVPSKQNRFDGFIYRHLTIYWLAHCDYFVNDVDQFFSLHFSVSHSNEAEWASNFSMKLFMKKNISMASIKLMLGLLALNAFVAFG